MIRRFFYGVTTILFVVCLTVCVNAVELVEPPDYQVVGVIGASYENGQAGPTHPMIPNEKKGTGKKIKNIEKKSILCYYIA
jgi:hypothetical protein